MKQKQEFKEVENTTTETDLSFINKSVKRTQAEKNRINKTLSDCLTYRVNTDIKTDINEFIVSVSNLLEIKTEIVKQAVLKEIGLNVDNVLILSEQYESVEQHNIKKTLVNFLKKFAKTYIKDYM